jgi:hypothetical protein
MWNKHDDPLGSAQPDSASKETPDLASLGDALVQSLMDDQLKKGNVASVPQKAPAEARTPSVPAPSMKTYVEAVEEFTKSANALIEQLPLLTKTRAAYEEALRASAEMRKMLDAGEENLRSLMTQLDQGLSVQGLSAQGFEPVAEKKISESKKVERMTGTDPARRTVRWP